MRTLNELRIRQLDAELRKSAPLRGNAPKTGWIREIRRAIGMTAVQLAQRLGVTQSAVTAWEKSEQKGTITLATLQKVADALGCDVGYVLIPRESLEESVNTRLAKLARERVGAVSYTMSLEQQAVSDEYVEQRVAALIEQMKAHPPKNMWS